LGSSFFGGCFYYYYVIGDASLSDFPDERIQLYEHSIFPAAAGFGVKELLFPVALPVPFSWPKVFPAPNAMIICVSLCANNAATLAAQSKAAYATGEAYGSEGAGSLSSFTLKNIR